MNEHEPGMIVNLGDGEIEATPHNTSLYRHLGEAALYDHVFIQTSSESTRGAYIFSMVEGFEDMSEYMGENGYPLHVNLREAAQCDIEAFDRMIAQTVADADFVPEEWGDERASDS